MQGDREALSRAIRPSIRICTGASFDSPFRLHKDASIEPRFQTPPDRDLVITDVEWNLSGEAGGYAAGILLMGGRVAQQISGTFDASGTLHRHEHLTSPIVVAPSVRIGGDPAAFSASFTPSAGSADAWELTLRGYLVPTDSPDVIFAPVVSMQATSIEEEATVSGVFYVQIAAPAPAGK